MAWEFIKTLFQPDEPRIPPDFEQQKLIWNDSTKISVKIRELVVEELSINIKHVVPEAEWHKDLGCSMDVVEVFMRCEEEFGIEIPDEDAEQCETVGKLTAYIQRKFGVEPKGYRSS